MEQVQEIAEAAKQRWIETSLTVEQVAALESIDYQVVDLGADRLAAAQGNVVAIDVNAAGRGWVVEQTADEDEGFVQVTESSFEEIGRGSGRERG